MSDPENIDSKKENIFITFYNKNKKIIISLIFIIFFLIISFFILVEKGKGDNRLISQKFVSAEILLKKDQKSQAKKILEEIINSKNIFYSPLALNIIIEQKLFQSNEIDSLFNKVIEIRGLDKDKKDLLRLKKLISTADNLKKEEIINEIDKFINSKSIWRNVAIKFLVNYLNSKNDKQNLEKYKKLLKTKR